MGVIRPISTGNLEALCHACGDEVPTGEAHAAGHLRFHWDCCPHCRDRSGRPIPPF